MTHRRSAHLHERPGWSRRVVEVAVAGSFVAAGMGFLEIELVCWYLDYPESALLLHPGILAYATFGFVVGGLWGILCETPGARRTTWRRRAFYLTSLFVSLASFQLVYQPALQHPGQRTIVVAPLAVAIVLGGWLLCRRTGRETDDRPVLGRRTTLAAFLTLLLVIASSRFGSPVQLSAAVELPNVLFIVMDTTRADRLSVYGHDRPTTPELERLASEGLVFLQAYSAAPWTLPSHASMFTGEYPSVHRANYEHMYLDRRNPTLAERFAERGFRVSAFHSKAWLSTEIGLMRGFEQHFDLRDEATTALAVASRRFVRRFRMNRPLKDKGARLVTETFIDWVDRHGDRPFFAFINYNEPHSPYAPPSPWREQFLGEKSDTPGGRESFVRPHHYNAGHQRYSDAELKIFRDLYDGAIAYQDFRMGEVFDHLRSRGLLDETLVIVTADHGEIIGEHKLIGHGWCIYNSLLHVPLIVRLPGVVLPGSWGDSVVETRRIGSMIELILAAHGRTERLAVEQLAASLRNADQLGGAVLSELFEMPPASELRPGRSRRERPEIRMLDDARALYPGHFKSIQLDGMKYIWRSAGPEELYDLEADPQELRDLSAERPDDTARLRDLLAAKVASLDVDSVEEAPEMSPELRRQFEALGYLQ